MFGRKWKILQLAGFSVHIDASWLIVAVLFYWTLAAAYFPSNFPALGPGSWHLMAFLGTVGLFFSIVIHEFCHALVARQYGLPMKGITLFLFGGVAEMSHEPASPKVEFLMAAAGPLASLVIAGLGWLISAQIDGTGVSPIAVGVIGYLWRLNLVLAIFNLIPAFPLDGGRILRSAIWAANGNLKKATRITSGIGSGFGFVLMLLGGLAFLGGNPVGGLWYILIGGFLRFMARASYSRMGIEEALRDVTMKDIASTNPVVATTRQNVREFVDSVVVKHWQRAYPVVDDHGGLVGIVSTSDLAGLPMDRWSVTRVADVMKPAVEGTAVAPDLSADRALERFSGDNAPALMVVTDSGRPTGVVSRSDLFRYLAVDRDLGRHESDGLAKDRVDDLALGQ